MVDRQESPTTSSHNSQVRPRPARAAQCPVTSKTPAASAISATTVIATRKIRTGPTRVPRSARADSVTGRSCRGSTVVRGGRAWPVWSRNAGPPRAPEPSASGRQRRTRTGVGPRGRGCAWPCASPGDTDLHPARSEIALGNPGCGIRARAAVDDDSTTRRDRQDCGERGTPYGGQRTELAQVHAHGETVRGNLVGRAHGAEQGGDDDDPSVRAAPGGGVHRGQVEGVVEDAGVEVRDRYGRRRAQTGVVGDVGVEVGADPEQLGGIG